MPAGWTRCDKKLPPDGLKVSVWFDVYPSPLSMGMGDKWEEKDCWREKGKWVHLYEGEVRKLNDRHITQWKHAA